VTLYTLILAGGRGSRLGQVHKGEIRIGGRSLFARVSEMLPDTNLLVSTGPIESRSFDKGVPLPDSSTTFAGPIAGISAATLYLRGRAQTGDHLLTVAIDTPFLPADYAARMQQALIPGAVAAYAVWGDAFYPTNAIYSLSALLDAAVPDSPKRLLCNLDAQKVDWTSLSAENPFSNLNDLADLIALGRRASAGK
jgi:molybdopterin-guanine dinucleotide biosynthesis protein A